MILNFRYSFLFISICLLLNSCQQDNAKQFTLVEAEKSGIAFKNSITETDSLNYFSFPYMYNGAGVGVGDFNNDGLEDIFFAGNETSSKLYINEGDFKFKDITEKAGLETNVWCNGVSIIDINQDGLQDIYISVGGFSDNQKRKNKLYINNGDLTFSEQSAVYGIDDNGYSTQSTFFDYDNDGDLDLYILTHANEPTTKIDKLYTLTDGTGPSTDRLYENVGFIDGHIRYKNVSNIAGITIEGYGLGIAVLDINKDGYQDLYIANDYVADDILYVNNKNGTFTNHAKNYFKQTSRNSMGIDAADINNDQLVDIVTLDMLPQSNLRKKTMTANMNHEHYRELIKKGYSPQFIRNALQLNRGQGANDHPVFSEVGRLAGIFETDWSWSPLLADYDNNGKKDLYISNGFMRDITDHDFQEYSSQTTIFVKGSGKISKTDILQKLQSLESIELPNFLYSNEGDLHFKDRTKEWGLSHASLSNGAAYADFNNDGNLDLVVNNLNSPAFLYRNNGNLNKENHYIQIKLEGESGNLNGIGASITTYLPNNVVLSNDVFPVRGFMSSSSIKTHIGLGRENIVDSIVIKWPNNTQQTYKELAVDSTYVFKQESISIGKSKEDRSYLFTELSDSLHLKYIPVENDNNDFRQEPLLMHLNDNNGPSVAVGDVNGDGLDDLFMGGPRYQNGSFFIQKGDGTFISRPLLGSDKFEDMGALFLDVDNDGDQDLYVVSGGSSVKFYNRGHYQDRLYLNDGTGNFLLDTDALPEIKSSGSCVIAGDYDNDGDLDLFIGGMIEPGSFPTSPKSYLLQNNGGKFTDVTNTIPNLQKAGMVRGALFSDYDNDNDVDLLLVGEWMPIMLFENNGGEFVLNNEGELFAHKGWYNSIAGGDMDNDGDIDYIVGNIGENTVYKATNDKPIRMYVKDFDTNNSLDPIITRDIQNKEVPVAPRGLLGSQLRMLYKAFPSYNDYANANMNQFLKVLDTTGMKVLEINTNASSYIENLGNGKFKFKDLPLEAQFSPIFGIQIQDLDQDGNLDILGVGNYYQTEVISGRYDAGKGIVLRGNGKGDFNNISLDESNFLVDNDAKSIARLQWKDQLLWIVGGNASKTLAYKQTNTANKAKLVKFEEKDNFAIIYLNSNKITKVENYKGEGYLSQASATLYWNPDVMKKIEFFDKDGELLRTYDHSFK
ncbi:VCBS repeat-containing protein [Joostella atrarenae]|uniref:VCBS repeat-containing protein n=1 Tax=Joostella atrarenae TaxID=679257 RepID=A0ABS9J764_9FLAO|nr:VCBS repeat-containing protein [Joostella atrarenae]MCF8716240.1 VCBS repeat-containing protein [Joostella atrarenae]